MNRQGQVGAFGIILLIILFIFLFTYIAPFLGIASDAMLAGNNLTGVAGFFFGNWMGVIFLMFIVVVLWKIAFGG